MYLCVPGTSHGPVRVRMEYLSAEGVNEVFGLSIRLSLVHHQPPKARI